MTPLDRCPLCDCVEVECEFNAESRCWSVRCSACATFAITAGAVEYLGGSDLRRPLQRQRLQRLATATSLCGGRLFIRLTDALAP
jgi:hypothetical protein